MKSMTESIREFFIGSGINSLGQLFVMGLRDMYDAEKQLPGAIETMTRNANALQLQSTLDDIRTENLKHVGRIEKILMMMKSPLRGTTCEAVEGMVEEFENVINKTSQPHILDAALVYAAQAIEHYKIARYGTLRAWAMELEMPEATRLIDQCLRDEKIADASLNKLAEETINHRAFMVNRRPGKGMFGGKEHDGSSSNLGF